jgi:hypothetical protein
MKVRNLTIVTASAAMALMFMIGSAERAEAHRRMGGGRVAAGITAAVY